MLAGGAFRGFLSLVVICVCDWYSVGCRVCEKNPVIYIFTAQVGGYVITFGNHEIALRQTEGGDIRSTLYFKRVGDYRELGFIILILIMVWT